jgi:hypothetical protein
VRGHQRVIGRCLLILFLLGVKVKDNQHAIKLYPWILHLIGYSESEPQYAIEHSLILYLCFTVKERQHGIEHYPLILHLIGFNVKEPQDVIERQP